MNDLFKKDISIKIISVLTAVLFWLYVYNTADNPYNSKTFTNIPLKIENETSLDDKGLEIKNKYKTSIDITIRGRQDALDKVRDSDFEAVLDLSRVNSPNDRTIDIIGPYCNQKDVTIVSFNPNRIDISVARIKDNSYPLEIIPNVTLKPGYKILKITPNVETVTLSGEEALIDSVDSVKATLDLKDIDRNVTKRVDCKVYNKDNKEIPSLSKNLSVEVKVEVAKEVAVNLVVTGTPDPDHVVVMQSVFPDKVRITGSPDVLAAIAALDTEPISIDKIKQDLNVTGLLKLPGGVKLADQPKEVTVSIGIEQLIIKDFTIGKGAISVADGSNDPTLSYEIKTESAVVQLKGRSSVLNSLDLGSINPTIDVTGLTEGLHKISLNLTLPSQVRLIGEVLIEVKVAAVQPASQ